ncbi:hypothetical protein NEOLI_002262 [Neolecta irregularis DAH-3]|uniref:Uncharacterized protein n=1 Tax=Neolecta irregularis (strain DAH-3) TaxID=1198029 RepID=A0A1U7LHN6_NEOID|nr:hypothetical protein NEOLI_002262 [Neolecta irregularis DAH-3]|eukprot:OLL22062.1 hypothetical protein NEOLI_002262 [Neolecta irregularis DAH-3]
MYSILLSKEFLTNPPWSLDVLVVFYQQLSQDEIIWLLDDLDNNLLGMTVVYSGGVKGILSLIQLSTQTRCLMIRLNEHSAFHFNDSLENLILSNTDIRKTSYGIWQDAVLLDKIGHTLQSAIELSVHGEGYQPRHSGIFQLFSKSYHPRTVEEFKRPGIDEQVWIDLHVSYNHIKTAALEAWMSYMTGLAISQDFNFQEQGLFNIPYHDDDDLRIISLLVPSFLDITAENGNGSEFVESTRGAENYYEISNLSSKARLNDKDTSRCSTSLDASSNTDANCFDLTDNYGLRSEESFRHGKSLGPVNI